MKWKKTNYRGVIYCAISPSNKKYYGFTTGTLKNRKKRHYSNVKKGIKSIFYDAIRKYNFNFIWEVIENIENDNKNKLKKILSEREIYWINREKTFLKEYGYNVTKGGDGGDTLSNHLNLKEISKKISASHKGDKNSFFGKNHTLKSRKKISKNAKERYKDPSKNPMYNKTIRDIWIEKYGIKEANRRQNKKIKKHKKYKAKRIICEYCKKEIAINIYYQFHGNRCKQRSNS